MQMLTSKNLYSDTEQNMGAQTAQVIFCFSVFNPLPISRAAVSITLNHTIPQDYFVIIHLSLPLTLFPNFLLPSSSSRTVFSLYPSSLRRVRRVSANFINRNQPLRHQWVVNDRGLFLGTVQTRKEQGRKGGVEREELGGKKSEKSKGWEWGQNQKQETGEKTEGIEKKSN